MSETMMYATVAVALLDAALSGTLLVLYARSYREVKAPFTLGLVLFAAVFVAQNLLAAYSYLVLMVFFPEAVQPFMLAIMILEAVALGMMVYATTR
jgi:hypothetical protein